MMKEKETKETKEKNSEKAFTKKHFVIRILLFVLISAVLGVGIYSWNARSLTGNVLPMPFGVGVAVVMSGSMEPELSINDLIIVKASDTYQIDDVVVFQDGNTMVVHKIIAIDGEVVTTKGTANNVEDEPIHVSKIKGKVVQDLSSIGAVVTVIKSPIVTIIILGVAVYLLVLSYRREKESEQTELRAVREEIERLKQAQNKKE